MVMVETINELAVGGMIPLAANDYPGCLSAIVFCQGCPLRCRYCHNPHLQARSQSTMTWGSVLAFLKRRVGLLDAVVFSGGEPTYQPALPAAVAQARDLGFKIGLHTAGCCPDTLAAALPYLDWIGLDIKALPDDYPAVTGVTGSGSEPFQAVRMLVESGIPFEVRTTVHPMLIDEDKIKTLADELKRMGVKSYALQMFRSKGCNDLVLSNSGTQTAAMLSGSTVDCLMDAFDTFLMRDA
jgi:anaerobic ribonucleoside-triphosphate reductase activating protein